MAVTLVLGGARSGKSKRAESLAECSGKAVCYVATAPHIEGDTEWQQRILHHRQRRPANWQCIEEPLALAELIQAADSETCLLIDCVTLWLNNLFYEERDVSRESHRLREVLRASEAEVIMVANEVGLGLVPESPLGRDFRDAQGRLNQQLAEVADTVEFVAAGLPLTLKG